MATRTGLGAGRRRRLSEGSLRARGITDAFRDAEIFDLLLGRLQKHLSEQTIKLEVTETAKELLAEEGYDRVFGARPLRP